MLSKVTKNKLAPECVNGRFLLSLVKQFGLYFKYTFYQVFF